MEKQISSVVSTKLKLPKRCKHGVARTMILSKMEQSDADILLFHGKSGFGKTELARQYCERYPGNVLWYRLDSSDNDVWKFLSGLDYLCSTRLQTGRRLLEAESAQAGFWQLLSGLDELLEQDRIHQYILVIDSLEHIRNDRILNFLRQMAAALPENLKLIFTTKGGIPDFLVRHIMSGECLVLDETALAFTEPEQRLLAGQLLSHEVSEQELIRLECERQLAGWPAALVLILNCIEKRRLRAGSLEWPYLFADSLLNDFVAGEVWQLLTPDEKDFMIRTSGMTELPEAVCDRALQRSNSGTLMGGLLSKALLHMEVEADKVVIRHHEAIRVFLSTQAERTMPEAVSRKSAEYYLETGDYARAAMQAISVSYTELIAKIVEVYGREMLDRDTDEILACCVRCLEEDASIAGAPALLGTVAQYYYKTDRPEQMERCLNQADSAFGKENQFGMYRALYKGLMKYHEDPPRYEKQISNTLFSLAENRCRLPYLKPQELAILECLQAEKQQETSGTLNVTLFGDFQVTVVKERKQLSWRTRKGSELFAILVELGGEAVGRKQLLQKLWSEDLPDNAVTMLHNMLYNIRKELSAYHMEDLIQYRDKMYCLNMAKLETDVTEIRHLCELVDQRDIGALKLHRERFAVYWGRYLDDLDNQWMVESREYYDTRFLKGCSLLAEDAAAAGQFQEAVRYLKNAMAINSYSEELAGSLLRCYGAMRNLKMVKLEYERFVSLLERDLELKPGRKLIEIYKEVMRLSA